MYQKDKKDQFSVVGNVISFAEANSKKSNGINGEKGLNLEDDFAKIALELIKNEKEKLSSHEMTERFIQIYNRLKEGVEKKENKRVIPEQTVFDDYIICLEDGKKMQMLKRHLRVHYGMTFQQYKEKWGLPIDYPCVCKKYSKVRANIARKKK